MAELAFDLKQAMAHLAAADPRLAALMARAPTFELQAEPGGGPYEALLEAIVYQSISGKAAAKIWARVKALGEDGRCPTPQRVRRTRVATLRRAGLSAAKAAAVKDLARAALAGQVPALAAARQLADHELVERLISIRGIGAWTVEMFLIFRLGRPDVLPVHDYGVKKGFAHTYGWPRLPTPRELGDYGERWRPYRTVAAWYLWRAAGMAAAEKRAAANGVT